MKQLALKIIQWNVESGTITKDFNTRILNAGTSGVATLSPPGISGLPGQLTAALVFGVGTTNQYTLALSDTFTADSSGVKGNIVVGSDTVGAINSLSDSLPKLTTWGKYNFTILNTTRTTLVEFIN